MLRNVLLDWWDVRLRALLDKAGDTIVLPFARS
jgi:hypothetical protein